MSEFRNRADFYLNGPFSQYVTEHRSAGRSPVHMIRTAQPPGDFSEPDYEDLVLIKMERDFRGVQTDFGAGRWTGRHRRDDFQLVAPNTAAEILVDENHEVTMFVLPLERIGNSLLEAALPVDGDFGRLHAGPFRGPELARLCRRLYAEANADHPFGGLYSETLAQTIVLELSRLAALAPTQSPAVRPLDAGTLRLVDELLDSASIADASLSDLAQAAGISEFHFSRAFKSATGQSPHQFLIERRLARARDLLEHSKDSIADIAYACGFSSQSHMTTTFSKQLGITPAKYRKERCE